MCSAAVLSATAIGRSVGCAKGRENSKTFLKENPEICQQLENAIRGKDDEIAEDMMAGPGAQDEDENE